MTKFIIDRKLFTLMSTELQLCLLIYKCIDEYLNGECSLPKRILRYRNFIIIAYLKSDILTFEVV